jgi:hypothetical protein
VNAQLGILEKKLFLQFFRKKKKGGIATLTLTNATHCRTQEGGQERLVVVSNHDNGGTVHRQQR